MTENAIVPIEAGALMPVVSSDMMLERYQTIVEIKDKVMKPGVHYGVIPGAGDKPTLLKPGAEVLSTAFMLYPDFETLNEPNLETLFSGLTEPGKVPFFQYRYRCVLKSRDGRFTVGTGIGSCSSWEKKYRYRNAERVCPNCGKNAIIKGKAEYGGGWLCFEKKGGCKAKFNDGDTRIEGQQAGQVDNPDIAEVINTIDKMAQKRALIAATLVAVGASDFFTQDVEDLPEFSADYRPAPQYAEEGVVIRENGASSAPQNAPEAHWTETQDWKTFWTWVKNKLNLTEAEAHAALGVETVKDYPGDKKSAQEKLEAAAQAKASAGRGPSRFIWDEITVARFWELAEQAGFGVKGTLELFDAVSTEELYLKVTPADAWGTLEPYIDAPAAEKPAA